MDRSVSRLTTLALTSLAHFVNDGTVFFVPVIAAIVAADRRVDPLAVTALFLIFYATSPVVSPLVGRLADRRGRNGSLMAIGVAVLSLGLLGFYFALSLTTGPALVAALLVSALVTGSGAAFYHPLGASLLQGAFHDSRRGLALGLNGALGSLGRALYPSLYFLGGLVITGYGSVALFAGIGLAAGVAIWMGVRVPARQREEQVASAGASAPSSEALTRGIILLTLVAFFRSVATRGIAAWIPTHLATERSLGVSADLGIAVTVMYASAVVGQPLFGLLVDRIDKRLVLGAASIGSAIAILGYLGAGANSIAYAWLFAFGLFTFSGFPLLLSMVNDYVPRRSSSLANALVWGVGNSAGNALGPVIVGVMIGSDYGRLDWAFTIFAALAVASSFATAFVPRPARVGKMASFGG